MQIVFQLPPSPTPTPVATAIPSAPTATTLSNATAQSTSTPSSPNPTSGPTSASPHFSYYIAPSVINGPIIVGNYVQSGGVTFTLGNGGVAFIQANSAQLSGTLYLDISQFDGTTVTLIEAANITGRWQDIIFTGSSSECVAHTADVQYTQTQVILNVLTTSLCTVAHTLASSLFALLA